MQWASNAKVLSKLAEACSGQVARGSINSLNLLQAGVKPEGMRKYRRLQWAGNAKETRAAYNKAYYDKKRAEAERAEQILQSFRDILSTQSSDFDKLG